MKNQVNNSTAKITRKYDEELLIVLKAELKSIKTKSPEITRMEPSKGDRMVA